MDGISLWFKTHFQRCNLLLQLHHSDSRSTANFENFQFLNFSTSFYRFLGFLLTSSEILSRTDSSKIILCSISDFWLFPRNKGL